VLVLDEPTNHLDIPSREALEGCLAGFDGTILCVSHDRYFLDKVVGRLFVLQPPNMLDFGDKYSSWVHKLRMEAEERTAGAQERSKAKNVAAAAKEMEPAAAAARDARKKDNPYLRPSAG